ncbi:hypothetical protein WJX74_008052 [Apatococcus lobatus]|uniref:40S ribosomal protein S15 n=2 Tax=Apatococcus TaxID=904362 RepID=A0AAW1T0Q2_9CHLO
MADDAGGKGRRTFRKFSYRGVDLDQLLDMSTDELVELFPARARRRFQRGLKRKPLALIKKLRKAKKEADEEFSISYKPVKHGKPGIGATHSSRFIPLK